MKDGKTDLDKLSSLLDDSVSCVLLQQPNYYGLLEDAETAAEAIHSAGAKYIMSCNPISLGMLKTPAEYGADIAVGDGQPLGLSLSFGGPYLGFMACTNALLRKIPGRIVGETTDVDGKRAYVLTLQAREQHIRREKSFQQHLLQSGFVRFDCFGLFGRYGSGRPPKSSRTVFCQGTLFRGKNV